MGNAQIRENQKIFETKIEDAKHRLEKHRIGKDFTKLGNGEFGVVYKGILDGNEVAFKSIQTSTGKIPNTEDFSKFIDEAAFVLYTLRTVVRSHVLFVYKMK